MTDRHLEQIAATPWEVEAERRREVLDADARWVDGRDPAHEFLAIARGRRLLSTLRGSLDDGRRPAGKESVPSVSR